MNIKSIIGKSVIDKRAEKIGKIEDITPAPEEVEVEGSGESADTNEETTSMMVGDVPLTIDNSVPENSKPVEEQLSLF